MMLATENTPYKRQRKDQVALGLPGFLESAETLIKETYLKYHQRYIESCIA